MQELKLQGAKKTTQVWLRDLGLGHAFLDDTEREQTGLIKTENFPASRDTIKKVRTHRMGENHYTLCIS